MTEQEVGLYRIWKEAFEEKDDYIALFFKEGRPLGQTLSCGPTHAPYAALTLFPIGLRLSDTTCFGHYLYALGVRDEARGKGYGSQLVQQAHNYAKRNGGAFLLLQPSSAPLFSYYRRLGYTATVSRARMDVTRAELETCSPSLQNLLLALSRAPRDRFDWAPPMQAYIRKECLFRGGAIITQANQTAYCYPNRDDSGSFVEIKEYRTPPQQVRSLMIEVLNAFPHALRFVFYGAPPLPLSPTQDPTLQLPTPTPFALLHFTDPAAEIAYHRHPDLYFAFGLD